MNRLKLKAICISRFDHVTEELLKPVKMHTSLQYLTKT